MAKTKLTTCKACGAQVAKSAKACPSCGAKVKKGHPVLIGIVVALILIGIIGASGTDDTPQRVESPTASNAETLANTAQESTTGAAEEAEGFLVGETAELNGISVSLVGVTESTGSQYNTPTEGNVFLLCEFEIANDSSSEIAVSSMLSFEAYCDDYVCAYSLTALLEKGNKNQLDGTVAAGKKFNGVIGYEVPADWSELEIRFTPDFWSGKDFVFIAYHE